MKLWKPECEICQKYKDHHYQDHVNGKEFGFYELMNGDFSQQLRIPNKFTEYCKRLPRTVDLKGPSGNNWTIGLHKTRDAVMLLHGWKEFVEVHNIQERDLLLFKYDGRFCFHVSIFDRSHCKKAPFEFFMGSKHEKEQRRQDSVEILNVNSHHKVTLCSSSSSSHDEFIRSPMNKKTTIDYHRAELSCKRRSIQRNEFPDHAGNKKPKCAVTAQDRADNIIHESVEIRNGGRLTKSNLFLRELGDSKIYITRSKHLSGETQELVLQLLCMVQPKRPCFISFMSASSVSNGSFLYIPVGFRKHLSSKNCTIFLQVPHERKKWHVNLSVYKTMTGFCWESFVLDNRLHVQDICLFELIEDETNTMMCVYIHRAEAQNNSVSSSSDDTCKTTHHRNAPVSQKQIRATRISRNNGCSTSTHSKMFCTVDNIKRERDGIHNLKKPICRNLYVPSRLLTGEEEKRALLLVDQVQPQNPSFIAFMAPYNVNSRKGCGMSLVIPMKFAEDCLPRQNSPIHLQLSGSGEKSCVHYIWRKDRSMICSGWCHFVLANNLKQGDACLFELTKKHPSIKMIVHIFRTATN